jgi:enoyl-CoA hydratase/carnithine racemase
MNPLLKALNSSVKPIVAVIRGGAIGISFTMLSLVDFIYISPDAHFTTPFMKTF